VVVGTPAALTLSHPPDFDTVFLIDKVIQEEDLCAQHA
jgi:hypothetical protein